MPMLGVQKVRNLAQTAILIGAMAGIAALCAWVLWGANGVVWAGAAVALILALSPRVPSALVMRVLRARPINSGDFPEGYQVLDTLGRRAGLSRPPRLYYIPSGVPNAFAVGATDDAAIAVTDSLLRTMGMRDLAAVLAHEVGHIVNGDLRIMTLVGTLGRAAVVLSYFGLFLLVLNLPLILIGAVQVPWLLALGLAVAPLGVDLLRLALSRAREYDADLEAVALTGDPDGLIAALWRLERARRRSLFGVPMPFGLSREPSLLRTHPPTEERVRRLRAMRRASAGGAAPMPIVRPIQEATLGPILGPTLGPTLGGPQGPWRNPVAGGSGSSWRIGGGF